MPCALCSVSERCDESSFHLVPATADMGEVLSGVLAEHNIVFERQRNLITLAGPGDHARVVALLRQVLSGPERQAVSVLSANGHEFPFPRPLDDWWRVFETGWFEDAMARSRFVTWFQPIVDSGERRVVAHECLIRLPLGRVYGGREIVETARVRAETRAFDSHVRSLSIRSAAAQSKDGVYFVNFAPSAIYNPESCLEATMQSVKEAGLQPENIVFEAVQSGLVRDIPHLRRIADYLRRNGFGFSLDDVGIGTESFQLVRDIQPDYIKLDRSLVRNVEHPTYAATIRRLVELADRFGAVPIAKGVETAQTMEDLWLLGLQCMQGYLFGRPGPRISAPDRDLFNLAQALDQTAVPELVAVN